MRIGEIEALYQIANMSVADIAEKLNISVTKVNEILKELGLK